MLEHAKEVCPCILVLDNAIKNPKQIIDLAIEKKQAEDATVIDETGLTVVNDVRKTKKIDISPSYTENVFWWKFAQKLWHYGDSYGKRYDIGFSNMENPQLLWYIKNEGYYKPHSDSGGVLNRVFSLVLYLNDVESGGETYFEHFDISVKPKSGRLLMFPGNFSYLHGAKTPLSNDKFAVVTWFNPGY